MANYSYYSLPSKDKDNTEILNQVNTPEQSFIPLVKPENFHNTIYSMNIALETKFKQMFFKDESNRIVWSRNSFAMRKRSQDLKVDNVNGLNFPFMNYKITKIDPTTKRPWAHSIGNISGVYIPELNRKIKFSPITVKYESTLWYQRYDDLNYAYQLLAYNSSVEDRLTYYTEIVGQEVKQYGIIEYSLDFDPTYDEEDWLKRNNIHTITMDFTVQSFYIADNEDICLPRSVLLDFTINNYDGEEVISDIHTLITDYYAEENTES